jgi:signal transduction histidine kinase
LRFKLIGIFFLLFLILESIGLHLSKSFKEREIGELLKTSAEVNHVLYNSILKSFENGADLIFDNIMENRERIEKIMELSANGSENIDELRKELQIEIDSKYLYFKTKYNVRQIHFHLPKAISFLRMHKPNKFGDSLWKVRPSLREVHEKREIVRGFEEGRIFNGFRNIYPIFSGDKFVGSVEISFSFQSIRTQAMALLPHHYKFMLSKKSMDIVWENFKTKNYIVSDLCEDFYYDINSDAKCEHPKHDEHFVEKIHIVNSMVEENVKDRLRNFEKFATYVKYKEDVFIMSFVPILSVGNRPSAYFISYEEHNNFIEKELKSFEQRNLILTIVIILSLIFIYLIIEKELKIRDFNDSLEKRIKKEIEKNRKKDRVILEQSKLSAMGEMINSIAHQWRQPLNRISLEMINIEEDFFYEELTEDRLHQYSNGINSNVQYLSKIIDDFRDFYKPTVDTGEKVKLKDVLNAVILFLKKSSEEKGIAILLEDQLESDFKVEFGREFRQVIINLISNSIDSIESLGETGGEIRISLNEDDKSVQLIIDDNGKGIEENISDRIFEPYFTTKFENQGTGMGLYVSKITIETNMGGSIAFKKKSSRGVRFVITLPKKR